MCVLLCILCVNGRVCGRLPGRCTFSLAEAQLLWDRITDEPVTPGDAADAGRPARRRTPREGLRVNATADPRPQTAHTRSHFLPFY